MSLGPQDKSEAAVFALEDLRADIQYEILKAMKSQGLTQADLARKLNKSRGWVSQILGDDANLTLDTISRIFLVLGSQCHFASIPLSEHYCDVRGADGCVEIADWIEGAHEVEDTQSSGESFGVVIGFLASEFTAAPASTKANDNTSRSREYKFAA